MADFLTNLWSSVFTPGASPTLLVATNVTFASLQILLAALLIGTYSIHFAILSFLCGGLWWSINWFATELQAAQAKEAEAEKLRKRKSEWRNKGEVADSADDEGEDTEVEGHGSTMKESTGSLSRHGEKVDGGGQLREEVLEAMKVTPSAQQESSAAATGAEQATTCAEVRQRRTEDVDRSGEISTDSEWEKVSQDGDR